MIDGSLSVGELVAFNMLAGRVSGPVLRLAQIWQDFHQARLSIARLGDILNSTAEPTYMAGRARLPAIRGNIKFDHVSFRYRIDGPEILHDVSFDVPVGQTVGIVGPSGSGKSTSQACTAPLRPGKRAVLVDGVDLAMADPRGCAARLASFCRRTCCSTSRCARISRSPTQRCRWSRSSQRQGSPERTTSSLS